MTFKLDETVGWSYLLQMYAWLYVERKKCVFVCVCGLERLVIEMNQRNQQWLEFSVGLLNSYSPASKMNSSSIGEAESPTQNMWLH